MDQTMGADNLLYFVDMLSYLCFDDEAGSGLSKAEMLQDYRRKIVAEQPQPELTEVTLEPGSAKASPREGGKDIQIQKLSTRKKAAGSKQKVPWLVPSFMARASSSHKSRFSRKVCLCCCVSIVIVCFEKSLDPTFTLSLSLSLSP